ncbi:MAG TPA: site-2 protease family protein [Terriglobales bacterium]|nr:site-2 protease family protein [Terriglobales bacterium]
MSDYTPPIPRLEFDPRTYDVAVVSRSRQKYWLHALLLLTTFFTTMMVGTRLETNFLHGLPIFSLADDTIPLFPIGFILEHPARILLGLPFSLTLMTILLAHEMGHYVMCLRYGVYATLPFFIPAPTLIGTMGAFIRIKSPIRTRTALFDIGIAGPIAGFIVASFVLMFSLMMSKPAPPVIVQGDIVLDFPLIFRIAHWMIMGDGMRVLPLEHMLLHPTAIAAWVGMFATALNLLPGGQLDGGHIIYSLMPRLHRHISRLTVGALIPMGLLLWPGWLIWAVLLGITGMRHPNVSPWPPLSPGRRMLGLVALALMILTITPNPFPGNALAMPHWF